ncbi:MAG: SdrD B-like domain-containing protein [Acidimicrobiales bacterium]
MHLDQSRTDSRTLASTPAPRRRRLGAALAAVAVVAGATVAVVSDAPLAGAGPAPVVTGYVPLPADETQAVMESVNAGADTTLDFTVGITNAGDGAIMYYDHWEDGFEADISNPVQSTTEVWGDGNPSNGDASTVCSSCGSDLLTSGDVFVLRNTITTPRNSSQIRYDGRDKVASTRGFAITAGGFSTPLGSVLSASASGYDTSKYGTDYVAPVGENTPTPSGTSPAFETSSLVVMAAADDTTVRVDSDGNGTVDTTSVIDEGEVAFVHGGVEQGAHVMSDKPVQVHEGTGDVGSSYESRWFTLFPTSLLSSDYLNPVASNLDNQRTITYLFNPTSSPITVTPSCTSCSGTLSIAAGTSTSFASPLGQATRFDSGGPNFIAVGASGAQSGAAPGSAGDGSATYDWGFALVPTGLLTTQAVLGWAPGNSTDPPLSAGAGHADDDPVWATTLTATTVHVDFDGDPATGALSSPDCFGSHDLELPVAALASTRITDPNDFDMTGARIYTCDGTKIAGAWGEDPSNAPSGSPGFDAGYAIIPSTSMVVDKTAGVATDANGDGLIGPGDSVDYDISISDAGSLAFTSVSGTDLLPAGSTYVPGTTVIDDGSTVTPIADDSVPPAATAFPLDESGVALPDITAGNTVHVRYRVTIDDPFPNHTPSITNPVTVTAAEASGGDVLTTPLASSDLSLTKSITTPAAHVGDDAVFRLTVSNAGPNGATGVKVTDLLPAGAVYVSSSPSAGSYVSSTGVWSVGTLANGASATLDITATIVSPSVTNSAEVTASKSIDPDSTPGNDVPTEDDQASVSLSVTGPSVGDTVWYDVNGNGTVDSGEPGLAGVDVTATWAGPNGTFGNGDDHAYTTTTDATGAWSITNLPAGAYRVAVSTGTLPNGIDSPTFDLDGIGSGSTSVAAFTLAPGVSRTDVDFGYTGRGVVGDTVFEDLNGNGTPQAGEGITGVDVTVTWFGPDGVLGGGDDIATTVTTDSVGHWSVGTLPAGNFRVQVDTADLPAGFANTVDPDGGTASRSGVTLAAGATDDAQDFGYRGSGGIGDTVWSDTDGDGVQDSGEPGLGGVTVTLLKDTDSNGSYETTVATAVTAGTGTYAFPNLSAGAYSVVVTPPTGLTATTATTTHVTLANAATDNTVDFGFEPPAPPDGGVIGDRVWDDTNGNGAQDTGEPGVGGVTVSLLSDTDGDGGFETTLSSITTSSDGSYGFAHLPPASYRVVVTTPAGRTPTTPVAITVPLAGGQSVTDADVGLHPGAVTAGSIGDRVWTDTDADGVQDGGETGANGVTVTLRRDADGDGTFETAVSTTTTSGDGNYAFTSLPPGSYQVVVSVPGGSHPTTPSAVPVTLWAGLAVTNADVGIRSTPAAPGSIGDRIWSDTDRDQMQDAGEAGLNGVTVTLLADADGDGVYTTSATAVTSGDGNYSFTGLAPGRYLVAVTSPAGMAPTSTGTRLVDLGPAQDVTDADVGLATPSGLPYDLRVQTSIEGTPQVNGSVVVRIDVQNGGPLDSPTDVTVVETLPDGLTYVSTDAPGWNCSASGQVVTCVLPAGLANGGSSTIGIRTTVGGAVGATLLTAATVSAAGAEITLANNAASVPVHVLAETVNATTTTTTTQPVASPSSPLAFTGGQPFGAVLLGLGLLLVGFGVVATRKRVIR